MIRSRPAPSIPSREGLPQARAKSTGFVRRALRSGNGCPRCSCPLVHNQRGFASVKFCRSCCLRCCSQQLQSLYSEESAKSSDGTAEQMLARLSRLSCCSGSWAQPKGSKPVAGSSSACDCRSSFLWPNPSEGRFWSVPRSSDSLR